MYRWFIALKYLRSRFITFAALLIVASAVALLIVILSVMEGFRTDLIDRIRGTSADLRVDSKDYIGIRDPRGLESKVTSTAGVRAVSPFIESMAMFQVSRDATTEYLGVRAVDLERDARVGGIEGYLEAARRKALRGDRAERRGGIYGLGPGSEAIARQPVTAEGILSKEWLEKGLWEATGEERPEGPARPVLVGWEATDSPFYLFPGRSFELTSFSPIRNRTCTGRFYVAGVFVSRDYQFDRQTIVLPRLADGVEFLDLRDPGDPSRHSISGIRVAAAVEDLDSLRDRIRAAVADVPFARVQTWREEKASWLQAVLIEKTVVSLILGILILFAGFMIFIVLTVQVVEKTRDLGILQSLGSTAWGIAGIYFLIGSGVCLTGTLLGTALGVGFGLALNTVQRWVFLLVGFDLFPPSVYYIDKLPVRLAVSDLVFIIVPTVVASLLASVWPALRAARKDPVVALRYE